MGCRYLIFIAFYGSMTTQMIIALCVHSLLLDPTAKCFASQARFPIAKLAAHR